MNDDAGKWSKGRVLRKGYGNTTQSGCDRTVPAHNLKIDKAQSTLNFHEPTVAVGTRHHAIAIC